MRTGLALLLRLCSIIQVRWPKFPEKDNQIKKIVLEFHCRQHSQNPLIVTLTMVGDGLSDNTVLEVRVISYVAFSCMIIVFRMQG